MQAFIFEYLSEVSGNYHEEGGLVVIARDKEHVYQLIAEVGNIQITEDEWQEVQIYELKEDVEPKVFVFPDAGCC